METTEQVNAGSTTPAGGRREAAALRTLDSFLLAPFPWYGLDEAFSGPRGLMQVGTDAQGNVEHGSLSHGRLPGLLGESREKGERDRFAVVVTVAANPVRRSPDGTGTLEATSVSSAAWLAGAGLLGMTWPEGLDHGLRDDWLTQQTETAFELADDLDGPDWSELSLPVDSQPSGFRYRETEHGWILAGSTPTGVNLGAYGRGLSAYGLGFSVVKDLQEYAADDADGATGL